MTIYINRDQLFHRKVDVSVPGIWNRNEGGLFSALLDRADKET